MQGPNKKQGKPKKQPKKNKTKPIEKQKKEAKPQSKKKPKNKKKQEDQEQFQVIQSEEKYSEMEEEVSQNKQKKSSNIYRATSGAKLGRPFQNQGHIEVCQDPCVDLQICLLQYLDKIGMKHGLVFRKQQRQKLIQENHSTNIQWNIKHEWNDQKQRKKILQNSKIVKTINQYLKQNNSNSKEKFDLIVELFLNTVDIVSQQCSSELYLLLAQILQSIKDNQPVGITKERAKLLYNKLKILNGKFTDIWVKYWIQLIKNEDQIKKHFIQMFDQLKKRLINLLQPTKFNEFKKFLDEQKQMDKQLLQIRNRNNKLKKNG